MGLAGCGTGHKMDAGYGMKISWWDRDALISIGRMRDSSGIVNECGI